MLKIFSDATFLAIFTPIALLILGTLALAFKLRALEAKRKLMHDFVVPMGGFDIAAEELLSG